jgi:hypothetical protein
MPRVPFAPAGSGLYGTVYVKKPDARKMDPNAGHVPHPEVPDLFYPPLLKFLR